MKTVQIAIDGPAGAGKSTIAQLVAQRFNYTYIDTGAMYRAITLKAMQSEIDLQDENAFDFIDQTRFDFNNGILFMDGNDVSAQIRTREVSNHVSLVSSYYTVRTKLVDRQRQMADKLNVVMDGRDIGYHVLPSAKYKFYLTADVLTRAQRRYSENQSRGITIPMTELVEEIKTRDAFDSSREHSPLRPADDAIIIDTSNMSIETVVLTIESKVRKEEQNGV